MDGYWGKDGQNTFKPEENHRCQSGGIATGFVHVQKCLTDLPNLNGYRTYTLNVNCIQKWTLPDFTRLCSVSICFANQYGVTEALVLRGTYQICRASWVSECLLLRSGSPPLCFPLRLISDLNCPYYCRLQNRMGDKLPRGRVHH